MSLTTLQRALSVDPATVNAVADTAGRCSSCVSLLVGVRRGKVVRRSYPCVPPAPPDPSTGVVPRLCERCWRRARYHDPRDTYRKQVRDKQRRWHEKRTKRAMGATKGARGVASKGEGNGRAAKLPLPAAPPPPAARPAPPTRRVSSAQRLLAGR